MSMDYDETTEPTEQGQCWHTLDAGPYLIHCELPENHGGEHRAKVQWA
jgi:hypothetical protein